MEVDAWALVAPGRRVQLDSISTAPDVVRVKRRDMSIMIFVCARSVPYAYLGTQVPSFSSLNGMRRKLPLQLSAAFLRCLSNSTVCHLRLARYTDTTTSIPVHCVLVHCVYRTQSVHDTGTCTMQYLYVLYRRTLQTYCTYIRYVDTVLNCSTNLRVTAS